MPAANSSFPDRLNLLAETRIFQGLPKTQLSAIAQLAHLHTYHKGNVVFHQGDEGNGFYVVQTGRVKIFKLSASGREQILHVFETGDHFAEVPAFDGHAFPASAAALEYSELLFFPRLSFLTLLEAEPSLAINMLKSFATHLRRFSRLVDDLSLREVPGRLAAHLLNLSVQENHAQQITLQLNKKQLAAMLGTIPETLSRVLYRMSQDGIITVEGNRITLLDLDKLRKISQ